MSSRAVADVAPRPAFAEGGPVRVVHLGAHPGDVERVRHHLRGHGARFAVEGVLTLGECLRVLAERPADVLLVDERGADAEPSDVLALARARNDGLPVIILRSAGADPAAAEAARLGAYDVLVKGTHDLAKLPLVLHNAAAHRRLVREREEFLVLSRFVASMGGDLDLVSVLRHIASATRDLLGTDRNLVLLVESGETLVLRASTGLDGVPPGDVRLPADSGLWAEVLTGGTPRRLDPMALSGPWANTPGLAGAEAVWAMPLAVEGRPLGLLLAASSTGARAAGSLNECPMLALAHHAAIAIQNARLAEQLLHAERLSTVGRMVAGVAHELNNPLAVILGTLDLVGHETLPDRLAERLGRVYQQAQRAVKIVRTLLALARKRPAQRQAVDVNAVIGGTLELLAYDPHHVDMRVVRKFATGLPPVLADPDQLQQVFTNLFLNASQAIREAHGQGTLTITTAPAPAGDGVVITVADTGPGIKAEHLTRVFEPFFTTKGEGQGTGLGLAICQRIVENHGGRISVESRPGAGARFRIELPVDREAPGTASPRACTASGAQPVLLVEDEPLVADMMEDILALDGHQVDRAATGREALARVGTRPYALVICDVRMPDLDGPAFYEALRQRDPALARRVVFVTGDAASPEARHFLEESGAPYLAKPFAVADFKSAVRRVLGAG